MRLSDVEIGGVYAAAGMIRPSAWRAVRIGLAHSYDRSRSVYVEKVDWQTHELVTGAAKNSHWERATDLTPWDDWWAVFGPRVVAEQESEAMADRLYQALVTRHAIVARVSGARGDGAGVHVYLDARAAGQLLATIEMAPRVGDVDGG